MTSVDIDKSLREQSKLLLRKLKEKQGRLQNIVNTSSTEGLTCTTNERFDTSLSKSVNRQSAKDGKQRLQRRKTKSKEEKERVNTLNQRTVDKENKENLEKTCPNKILKSKEIDTNTTDRAIDTEYDTNTDNIVEKQPSPESRIAGETSIQYLKDTGAFDSNTCLKKVETPNTVRRRKIIDRNVKVNGATDLNASELLRECEEDFPRLNYSYSNIDDTDLKFLQSRLGPESSVADEIPVRDTDTDLGAGAGMVNGKKKYSDNLENPGNSRKFAKFIRETNKPKSILLSTSQRQNKSSTSNSSRVSFRSPNRDNSVNSTSHMDSTLRQNQRMLGYDWIAALIDNDPDGVNQSETFFEELKEFRKINLDECVNQMYMDGPQELWEHPEREPSPVQRALEETKQEALSSEVKPYLVNDRLFTEPIQRSLFARYDDPEARKAEQVENEGTYEEPHFVRVSIPRSTLMSPHRVKPHRRNSFDPTDTMALSEHCLKGWTSSEPSMMPAASNIGLRDSTLGIKSSHKTTLHDAETLAANYPYEWNPAEQTISRPAQKPTYRPESTYMDSTWPASVRDPSTSYSHMSSQGQGSHTLKRATDDLLSSTYSLMYEMQRLKTERSDDPIRV